MPLTISRAIVGAMIGLGAVACTPRPPLDDRAVCAKLQDEMPVMYLRSRTDPETVANVRRANVRFHAVCTANSSPDDRPACQALRAVIPVKHNVTTTDAVTLRGIRRANARFAAVCAVGRS